MKIDEIDTVLYIGAGTMGSANSMVAAVAGYDVILHDARPENLETVAERHDGAARFLVESGFCTAEAVAEARKRVFLEADLEKAAAKADLMSESIFEDRQLKRDIHARLDALCPHGTILTTNTSSLLVSDLEDAVERGDRFAAMHSHLGALLVDIVGGPRTSPETIDILRRYVHSLGAVPLVMKKEHPGYVFNAMNGPVLRTAVQLVLDERASKEDVDRAWMSDRWAPMGPFGMMDLFGLDLMLDSWKHPSPDPRREAFRERVVPFLTAYIENGNLGLKSGQGFYDYAAPTFREPTFLTAEPVSQVASDALVSTLVRSALALSENEVATRADIDLAWKTASGLASGPFETLEEIGVGAFREILDRQVEAGLLSAKAADATGSSISKPRS
jgi:enoyl-CoA hydratase/3-hydroxyacyl-CoA dehydrogenase